MIITKEDLIQEGVLDFVKNNYGKGVLGIGALLAAKAGVFGDAAKNATNKGIDGTSEWMSNASDKIVDEYGTPAQKAVVDAKEKLSEMEGKLPVDNSSEDIIDKIGEM